MLKSDPIAVIGGGWAGLAAAVTLCAKGHRVVLFEMATRPGGRARAIDDSPDALDNGQHILIGAYAETLALMRRIGASPESTLHRQPLTLRYPDGRGLQLPGGPAWLAFVRGVITARGWSTGERLSLLRAASGWMLRGFRCDPLMSVGQLCKHLPERLRNDLIEPLCVAALNTPSDMASATVFLRVLRDALFSGPGAADLLLPRVPLSALLPEPAMRWLTQQGTDVRLGHRVQSLSPSAAGWLVDGEPVCAVILACTAVEAARLVTPIAPDWARCAQALHYEPIVTVYFEAKGARLRDPMTALQVGPRAPAQYVFDLGALGGCPGRFACAISGAAAWVERGLEATGQATLEQVTHAFAPQTWPSPPRLVRTLVDKRATFRCAPGLVRPGGRVASHLYAAGDYVDGPYPATLEGAVRSGRLAAEACG